ncbi:hypothetical protein P3T40_007226 [Paraburkholderia sp. EB58]|jgi:hypothetical protein
MSVSKMARLSKMFYAGLDVLTMRVQHLMPDPRHLAREARLVQCGLDAVPSLRQRNGEIS